MAVPAQNMQSRIRTTLGNNPDIPMAIAVIGTLMVLIVPLHPLVLDMLLTINISLSVVILLSSLYLKRAADFSIFPSLLLILTLFRLSLNLASTRLILQDASAGNVIEAFGSYVTYGNLFVGIVIFIILVVIQFVVITKGATRISEVAARFTLDAMPGKQMGVDSDLNAGLISEDEARRRRREIEKEADFYGAMDGATKFVRGDAVAGIIITIVNIVVGLIIGTTMHGLSFGDAAKLFTTLTIGDGLVSQIPSLIVSTAAGLVVTRTASEESSLGADFGQQMTRNPRALAIAGLTIALIGIAPGMPKVAFMGVGAALGVAAYYSQRMLDRREELVLEEEVMAREEEEGVE